MAFIGKGNKGTSYSPGYFLADPENAVRVTKKFKSDGDSGSYTVKTDENSGAKYVPMGTIYKESATGIGIVYEDVDVTNGEAAGSVVIEGTVYKDRLPTESQSGVDEIKTITVIDKSPTVTRPDDFNGKGV